MSTLQIRYRARDADPETAVDREHQVAHLVNEHPTEGGPEIPRVVDGGSDSVAEDVGGRGVMGGLAEHVLADVAAIHFALRHLALTTLRHWIRLREGRPPRSSSRGGPQRFLKTRLRRTPSVDHRSGSPRRDPPQWTDWGLRR